MKKTYANEIRKYQFEKKLTPKELFNEKKKVCLLDNGIELADELNNIEEEGNMSEEIKEEEISKNNADENINNNKNKTNKLYKSQIDFNHNILSLKNFDNQSMTTKNKKVYNNFPSFREHLKYPFCFDFNCDNSLISIGNDEGKAFLFHIDE